MHLTDENQLTKKAHFTEYVTCYILIGKRCIFWFKKVDS